MKYLAAVWRCSVVVYVIAITIPMYLVGASYSLMYHGILMGWLDVRSNCREVRY